MDTEELKRFIRAIPNFPKQGIIFRDIMPLLQNPVAFRNAVDKMGEPLENLQFDTIATIESRGYFFAAALGYRLGKGLVVSRKRGKLPFEKISTTYNLEYGTDTLEMHKDAVMKRHKIVVVDDLLATGNTAKAVGDLIRELGGEIVGYTFLIELTDLNGRELLKPYPVWSLIKCLSTAI